MLGRLSPSKDVRVLLDATHADDAGAVRLESGRALLHTVDVITPIVDDARAFGQIAAANAVSDIYAMAGRPTSAVSILGVPKALPADALLPILEAARDLLAECGAFLVGGHTLKDQELKLGFAVTGEADPKALATHRGARPGQLLVLTKPLGTGILHQASKQGPLSPAVEAAWLGSMRTPNRDAAAALLELGVRTATDVTGFGLGGHALNLARASGVDLILEPSSLPVLPEARALIEGGVSTGAGLVNLEGYGKELALGRAPEWVRILLADPQTSGGLLFLLPRSKLSRLRGLEHWVIGEVRAARARAPRLRIAG